MKKSAGEAGKKVSLRMKAAPGSSVFVAGTFNNWNPSQIQLRDNPESGVYRATLMLARGCYEYKFVVNGEWHVDPNCSDMVRNAHGTLNSVMSV